MRFALDTNRYVDFCRGEPDVVEAFRQADRIYVPFVVLAELRAGFLGGTRSTRNEQMLTRFLSSSRVRVLFADAESTQLYAKLFQNLKRKGRLIPTNDIWIATMAVQHDLPLYARDAHFVLVEELALL